MSLQLLGSIELPAHTGQGGFDHAAIYHRSARLYVAHTANNALDVIDCHDDRYLHSLPGLTGIAGALAAEEHNLVFTSNRGENTVGIFSPNDEAGIVKVTVGGRPNGLAYAPAHHLLLAANVGHPEHPDVFTLSMVNVAEKAMIADIPVSGRTRWTVFDPQTNAFYVNIGDPAQIAVVEASDPTRIARTFPVPAAGPHGLDLDTERGRLFCACDGKKLLALDARSGRIQDELSIVGVPDVIFFNAELRHLYVAIGDPGVVEVFDTETMTRLETMPTERGAHTIDLDAAQNKVYAFLPQTHRAAVFLDEG